MCVLLWLSVAVFSVQLLNVKNASCFPLFIVLKRHAPFFNLTICQSILNHFLAQSKVHIEKQNNVHRCVLWYFTFCLIFAVCYKSYTVLYTGHCVVKKRDLLCLFLMLWINTVTWHIMLKENMGVKYTGWHTVTFKKTNVLYKTLLLLLLSSWVYLERLQRH